MPPNLTWDPYRPPFTSFPPTKLRFKPSAANYMIAAFYHSGKSMINSNLDGLGKHPWPGPLSINSFESYVLLCADPLNVTVSS